MGGDGDPGQPFTVFAGSRDDTLPDVAANDDGGFLVIWERSLIGMGGEYLNVYGRRTSATAVDGDVFAILTDTEHSQVNPQLAYGGDVDEYLVSKPGGPPATLTIVPIMVSYWRDRY